MNIQQDRIISEWCSQSENDICGKPLVHSSYIKITLASNSQECAQEVSEFQR